jgi:hypothetical protein
MQVTFGKGQTAVPVATPQEAAAADSSKSLISALPAVVPPASLPAARGNNFTLGDFLPPFEDVIFPRLNLVHNTGALKDFFIPGSLVLGRATALFVPPDLDTNTGIVRRAATPPVVVTVLGHRPERFVEKPDVYVPGQQNQICYSEDEVRAAGGTTDYKEWKLKKEHGMRRFDTLVDFAVIIERPEIVADDDTVFVYQVGSKKYTLALWALKSTAYTAVAKGVFFTQRRMGSMLKGGYPSMSWNISSRVKPFPGGTPTWVPIATPNSKSSPEMIDFAKQILTGNITPADAPEETAAE